MKCSITLFALLAMPVLCLSATINVPADYESIQAAIDASVNGDTVLVAPNTYFEHIDFKGKAITVMSSGGPELTEIDGSRTGIVVQFINSENSDSILKGFTITNGFGATLGGGIFCNNSSPLISGNIIFKNTAAHGGGICCQDQASPTITKNMIVENTATATGVGGGGGIALVDCSPEISNNIIAMNKATHGGGGIGGISVNISLVNNTLFGNSADVRGGGLSITDGSVVYVLNTIFWENSSPLGLEIKLGSSADPSTLNISYSDIKGGKSSVTLGGGCTLNWGAGMIDADPMFVDSLNNDFHLASISPCINRGVNDGAPSEDIDGDACPNMGTVDIGTDEYTGIHPLEADAFSVSEATGGTVNFALNSGTGNRDRIYLILGSLSGTAPGTSLPGGYENLRLNWDLLTDIVLGSLNSPIFMDFLGMLDWSGHAAAQLNVPPVPGLSGTTMHYAYCLSNPFDFVSNPVAVELTP